LIKKLGPKNMTRSNFWCFRKFENGLIIFNFFKKKFMILDCERMKKIREDFILSKKIASILIFFNSLLAPGTVVIN